MSVDPQSADLALKRVRRIFSPRGQRLAAIVLIALALFCWGFWWLTHKHISASLQFGFLDSSVRWYLDGTNWSQGGATEVNLARHYQNTYWGFRAQNPGDRLAPLADLHRVEALDLSDDPDLRDHEFVVLDRLTGLKVLSLARPVSPWNTPETYRHHMARVAPHLAHLTRLEDLDLSGTDLADADIDYLMNLKRLKRLDLTGTKITDRTIRMLVELTSLEELIFDDTTVTREAIAELSRARPELTVVGPSQPGTAPTPP